MQHYQYEYVTMIQGTSEFLDDLFVRVLNVEALPDNVVSQTRCETIKVPDTIVKHLSETIDIDICRSMKDFSGAVYALYSEKELSRKDWKYYTKDHRSKEMHIHSVSVLEPNRITKSSKAHGHCLLGNNSISFDLEIIPLDDKDAYAFELDSCKQLPYYLQIRLQQAAFKCCKLGLDGKSPIIGLKLRLSQIKWSTLALFPYKREGAINRAMYECISNALGQQENESA